LLIDGGRTAEKVVAPIYVSPYNLGAATSHPADQNGDARLIDLIPLCGKLRAKLRMGNADPRCTHICTEA
jgi:hypothetical protein